MCPWHEFCCDNMCVLCCVSLGTSRIGSLYVRSFFIALLRFGVPGDRPVHIHVISHNGACPRDASTNLRGDAKFSLLGGELWQAKGGSHFIQRGPFWGRRHSRVILSIISRSTWLALTSVTWYAFAAYPSALLKPWMIPTTIESHYPGSQETINWTSKHN